jgi:hypothetical protein
MNITVTALTKAATTAKGTVAERYFDTHSFSFDPQYNRTLLALCLQV